MKIKLLLLPLVMGCLLIPSLLSHAQSQRGQGVRVRLGDRQEIELYTASYALVIGVSKYARGWNDLPGVLEDVPTVKRALEKHGFQVTTLLNPTRLQFDEAMGRFVGAYGQQAGNRLVVYFAGHGHTLRSGSGDQGREIGYIIPTDTPRPDDLGEFKRFAVSMSQMHSHIEQIEAKHALFVFDSCFAGTVFRARSSNLPEAITDKIIQPVRQFITAGTASQTVPDQSRFRRAFVAGLDGAADTNRDGFITGVELGEYLHNEVSTATRRAQTPQHGKSFETEYSQGDLVFVTPKREAVALIEPPKTQAAPAASLDPAAVELTLWQSAERGGTAEDYEEYLRQYPNGRFVQLARNRVAQLRKAAAPPRLSFQGVWKGTWSDGKDYFDCEARFEPNSETSFMGSIIWTFRKTANLQLVPKIGMSATEHIRGLYDPAQRILTFEGYKEDDPQDVIDLDKYRLLFSEDGQRIHGKSFSGGTWRAEMSLSRVK